MASHKMCHKELDTFIAKSSAHMVKVTSHARVTKVTLSSLLQPASRAVSKVAFSAKGPYMQVNGGGDCMVVNDQARSLLACCATKSSRM